jgi:hypothetical protein
MEVQDYLAQAEALIRQQQQQDAVVLSSAPGAARPQQGPPQVVVVNAAQTKGGSGSAYNWGMYIAATFVALLLTFVCVELVRDLRNRDKRNRRYNLDAYVDHVTSLANRLPQGHVVSKLDDVPLEEFSSSDEEEEEEYDSEVEK